MSKQYTFKTTKTTTWLESILDGMGSKRRSEFIRESIIKNLTAHDVSDKAIKNTNINDNNFNTSQQVTPSVTPNVRQEDTPNVRQESPNVSYEPLQKVTPKVTQEVRQKVTPKVTQNIEDTLDEPTIQVMDTPKDSLDEINKKLSILDSSYS